MIEVAEGRDPQQREVERRIALAPGVVDVGPDRRRAEGEEREHGAGRQEAAPDQSQSRPRCTMSPMPVSDEPGEVERRRPLLADVLDEQRRQQHAEQRRSAG